MLWIGIDTGVNTGVAVWDSDAGRLIAMETMAIDEAMDYVRGLRSGNDVRVVVEDARRRRWVPDTHDIRKEMSRRLGAGSIKRDARIWEDFLKRNEFDFQMTPPRRGLTKWTRESFASVTGYTGRTTGHSRDAAMLVFGR